VSDSKARFFSRAALKRKTVTLPDDCGDVKIRQLSAAEVDDYLKKIQTAGTPEGTPFIDVAIWVAVRVMLDEDDKQIFTDDDAAKMRTGLSIAVLNKIVDEATPFSGIQVPAAAGAEDSEDPSKKPAAS
jgi:hypothetical protein